MTTKTITLIKREALFVPYESLPPSLIRAIKEKYSFRFYNDKACAKCEFAVDKHSDLCETCAAYQGGKKLAYKMKVGGKPYLKMPIGDIRHIEASFRIKGYEVKYVDKNPLIKIAPFKFTGTLKDYQEESVEVLAEKKRGILKSPPRSGKTVMATAFVAKKRLKTIIIASQRDWLVGFLETFIGSKTQKPLTNLNRSRIGFAKKLEDFDKYDICLCTVQTFWSEKGQALLAKIRDKFSIVIYDEVHTSAAPKYSMVASRINTRYSIGLSGTPSRKDGKIVITNKLIGPVIHKVDIPRLVPRVETVRTKYQKYYKGNVPWTRMVSSLENDPQRLKLIAKYALEDRAAGHMVLIPLTQVKPIRKLIAEINKQAGRRVAFPFYGALKKEIRDKTIEYARNYKIKIIVGNTKLLSTGINIPRASCLYDVAMSSNLENCEQRVSRILTPWDDKPQPLLRIFLDEMNVRKRCLSNEWWRCVVPKFKPEMTPKEKIALEGYLKAANTRNDDPMDL